MKKNVLLSFFLLQTLFIFIQNKQHKNFYFLIAKSYFIEKELKTVNFLSRIKIFSLFHKEQNEIKTKDTIVSADATNL